MANQEEIYSDPDTYVSKRYSALGGKLINKRQNENWSYLLDRLDAESGDSVLELGSGPALLSDYLSDDYEMTAADAQRNPLLQAKEHDRSNEQVQVDAHRLPFQEDSFDYVIAPRLMHLDIVNEPEVVEELDRVAEKGYAFDCFSRCSGRALYNWGMHLVDDDMPKSNLHTESEVDSWIEENNEVVKYSDFLVPFGVYRENDDLEIVSGWEFMQENISPVLRESEVIPDLNSLIYRGVRLED